MDQSVSVSCAKPISESFVGVAEDRAYAPPTTKTVSATGIRNARRSASVRLSFRNSVDTSRPRLLTPRERQPQTLPHTLRVRIDAAIGIGGETGQIQGFS